MKCEMSPLRHVYLNIWSLVGDTVCRGGGSGVEGFGGRVWGEG